MRLSNPLHIAAAIFFFIATISRAHGDALPSWNDANAKKNLVRFVQGVTQKGSNNYVIPSERIAVFDNDGTLWSEQPMYFQLAFIIDRVHALSPQHPEWKNKEPFASVLKGDIPKALAGGTHAILELAMVTHAGISTDEFAEVIRQWVNTAKHPKTGKLYKDMVFQPMLELLSYLRENDFKTFIVSGGGIEFMRVFAEEVYGIPPEQIIGSSIKTEFKIQNGNPVILKLPELNFIDDKEGKPVAINQHIGRRPIAAFGNSDGDLQMLQWTCLQRQPNLCMIVHHTDKKREWAYDRESHIGTLDKALIEASKNDWTVVNMKEEWKVIYP